MRCATLATLLVLATIGPLRAQGTDSADYDPRRDWEVRPGFALEIDTRGYRNPSAIAFVPDPGPDPKDPLYFVTELRGRVKVVTNDRTVLTFAEGLSAEFPKDELPDDAGEHGVAGLCLDPAHGYVFVTLAYEDSSGVLRNNIVRFATKPRTFATVPTAQMSFAEIFSDFASTYSHQIGPCEVWGETLMVSVGDGHEMVQSQYPASPLGKILRMTLDGRPVRDNPFYEDDDVKKPQNYVWAMGFRNPFSLERLGNRWFVADNGINADRFIEIRRGENYGWNGSDRSLTMNALHVFAPAGSPTSLEYHPRDSELFPPEYRDRFYIVLAGKIPVPGPGRFGERSIMMLDYDPVANRMRSPPEHFVRYRGAGNQVPVGMAFGPDGLYFASILPDETGSNAIFRVRYDPAAEHAFIIGRSNDPETIIAEKQCLGCHTLGGRGSQVGPTLEAAELVPRLERRLASADYAARVAAADSMEAEPWASHADARAAVMAAAGRERVRLWLQHRLLEPRFDGPAAMPRPDLTEAQARILADYLMTGPRVADAPAQGNSLVQRMRAAMPPARHRYTALAFLAGMLFMLVLGRLLRRSS